MSPERRSRGSSASYGDLERLFDEMFYWAPADAARTEVDFLLRKGSQFVAIEVKSSRRLSGEDFRGLRAIDGLKGLTRRILVAPVSEARRTEDGIDVVAPLGLIDAVRAVSASRLSSELETH